MKEAHLQTPVTATGGPRPKLDLRLRTLVELGPEAFESSRFESMRFESVAPPELRRTGPFAFLRGGFPTEGLESCSSWPTVQVFLSAVSSEALDRLIGKLGELEITVVSRARSIVTAEVPLSRIHDLESSEDVLAIEWTGAFRPTSETGLEAQEQQARAHGPRKAMGLDGAPADLDGRGCLVGVVDVGGIDFYHPDFVDGNGRSRIRALWDQRAVIDEDSGGGSVEGASPGTRPYGLIHDRSALDSELNPAQYERFVVVPHVAVKGSHGTTSAALAAGLGGGAPDARGIAPGAEIVFVNTYGSGPGSLGAMTELADAIAFAFEVADADRKPCVVNVSLGDDLGPRDGTSPVERFIDELLLEPGRAVVVAAGNSGGRDKHVVAELEPGRSATLEILVGAGNRSRAVVEIWYDTAASPDVALDVEIEAPAGAGTTGRIVPDGAPRAFDAEQTRVLVASERRVPVGANGLIRVEVLPAEAATLLAGTWKIHLHARGGACSAHGWIDHRYIKFVSSAQVQDTQTITTPGTARRAIVVGGYDLEKQQAFWFSGRGPGRHGARKPDLVAPGGPLFVAYAASTVRYVDKVFGTSVAAPLVAGAIALLFQRLGKGLHCEEILGRLLPHGFAQHDDHLGRGPVDLAHLGSMPPAPTSGLPGRGGAPSPADKSRLGAAPSRSAGRPRDAAQIMPGSYLLYQGEVLVGHLLVTEDGGEGRTVEHWMFRPSYRPPSQGTPRAELRFLYAGVPIRLLDFVARFGPRSTYIRALCTARVIHEHPWQQTS